MSGQHRWQWDESRVASTTWYELELWGKGINGKADICDFAAWWLKAHALSH